MYGGKVNAITEEILNTKFTAGVDFYLHDWEGRNKRQKEQEQFLV
ncbi:hypothetical protein MASR2M54_04940 [Aliarcobacter cryaerophilus]